MWLVWMLIFGIWLNIAIYAYQRGKERAEHELAGMDGNSSRSERHRTLRSYIFREKSGDEN
ncbi:hypothetical protein [Listeria ilorinensis]|uniref:hypothetical protein n=1 Tax=Listeria ilorinensis TaxID=2867439 RepID=UPI001EF6EE73|nr:hypothetical protein [Listeria ilorinensis]